MSSDADYGLTEHGRSRTRDFLRKCSYAGPAPVTLESYTRQVRSQSFSDMRVSRADVENAYRNLVIRSELRDLLGSAMNSGKPMFLYGPSGSGKTFLAESLMRLIHDTIYVPYSLVAVGMDTAVLTATLNQLLPSENDIKISSAADSLVLSGTVSDAAAADRVIDIASAYVRRASGGRQMQGTRAAVQDQIVNLMSVAAPQQVMLEVKVAEISKALLDQFGINFSRAYASGGTMRFLSGILGGNSLIAGQLSGMTNATVGLGQANVTQYGPTASGIAAPAGSITAENGAVTEWPIGTGRGATSIAIDAQKQDGLVKILAEPTIMAISGQEGRFNAGGKIFIPVAQNTGGGTAITLEEKPFGVGLKFTPTVLSDGRVNLKVGLVVSELSPQGVTITSTNTGGTQILPAFTERTADTTVQLMDGQSFAIGGLIKNNVTANVTAFPLLGELPIIGALFRSTSFRNDRSELVFVITPRLVKPLPADYALPTDGYVPPTRSDMILHGRLEGQKSDVPAQSDAPDKPAPATPPSGGFEVK